jgi:hypothetical protein
MKYNDLLRELRSRYDNDCYNKNAEYQLFLQILKNSENLSDGAKEEFAKIPALTLIEFGLEGKIYLGSELSAKINYPQLLAEAASVDIKIAKRGE